MVRIRVELQSWVPLICNIDGRTGKNLSMRCLAWRKVIGLYVVVLVLTLSVHQSGLAHDSVSGGGEGGGDAFPHFCVSFAGKWKSDSGDLYKIEQKKCEHVVIALQSDNIDVNMIELVPDNKEREIQGGNFIGTARHAWNSLEYGTAIVMNFRYVFDDRIESEVRTFEYVNYYLLLESIHRTIEDLKTGEIRRESSQELFRRCRRLPAPNPGQDPIQQKSAENGLNVSCEDGQFQQN